MRKLVLASVSALALGLAGAAGAQTGSTDPMKPGSSAQAPAMTPGGATTGTPMTSDRATSPTGAPLADQSAGGATPPSTMPPATDRPTTTTADRPATSPGNLGMGGAAAPGSDAVTDRSTTMGTPGGVAGAGGTAATVAGGYRASELIGKDLVGPDGNEIAEVSDLIIDANHMVRHVVVDVGGFLGIGSKPVAIEMAQIQRGAGERDQLMTTLTKEQLQALPPWDRGEGRGADTTRAPRN